MTHMPRKAFSVHASDQKQKGYSMTNEINFDEIDLSQGAPAQEPQRQYYFMKKARDTACPKGSRAWQKAAGLYQNLWLPDECPRLRKAARHP